MEDSVVLHLARVLDGLSADIIVDLKGEIGKLLWLISFAQPLEGVGWGQDERAGNEEASSPLLPLLAFVEEADLPNTAIGEIEQA